MKTEQLPPPRYDLSDDIVAIESAIFVPQDEVEYYLNHPDMPMFALEIGGTMVIEHIVDNRTGRGGSASIEGSAESNGYEYAISYCISFPGIIARALCRFKRSSPRAKLSYTVV